MANSHETTRAANSLKLSADKIVMLPVSEVRPYDKNPRKNADAVKFVKASIEQFGFKVPIIIDSNRVIVCGHTRLMAAKSLGMAEVPCIVADDLTDAQVKALRLADNKVAEFSEWDMDLLGDELDAIADACDIDMGDFGFDLSEFDNIGMDAEEPEVMEDEVPEEVEPVCKAGELWQLGEHRLMCGDSTDADAVAKLMNGERADLVFTDPPYGMKKESEGVLNDNLNFDDLLEFNKRWIPLTFANLKDNGSWYCWGIDEPLMDIYSNILRPMQKRNEITFRNLITWDKGNGQGQLASDRLSYATADEKCLFVMCGTMTTTSDVCKGFENGLSTWFEGFERFRSYFEEQTKKAGLNRAIVRKITNTYADHYYSRSQYAFPTKEHWLKIQSYCQENGLDAFTWDYNDMAAEYSKERNGKEYAAILQKQADIRAEWYATRAYFDNTHDNMNNVWHFDRTSAEEREGLDHATPKPIAICARGIKTSSREGEIVLDVFGGSGSTMIACEQLGRKCRMMELDPHYCDVIIARWEKLTGQKAEKLEG